MLPKIGGLEETVTVSGQSPVVDVQNVVQQRVMTRELLEALPTAKSIQSMTAFIPGLSAGLQNHDVGGTVGDQPIGTAIHGSRANDQHMFYDAQIAPSLGRNLSAGAAGVATLQLVEPGTMFGGRLNQVDMRLMKMFRINSTSVRGIVDLYNLFNASPVTSLNQRYGPAWQQPFIILPARFAKFGVQVDF